MDTETVLTALRWRYATKQFDSTRTIDPQTWHALEEALVLAPSSFGIQPWRFFVVTDPELKQRLAAVSWGQAQLIQASHVVVFARKNPITSEDVHFHLERTAEIQGIPVENLRGFGRAIEGFLQNPPYPLDPSEWATRQTYIALGVFLTAAALLGIDTSPMEGMDPAAYDTILGIEGSGYETVTVCPAGYRHPEDKYARLPKVRFPKSRIIKPLPENL